MLHIINMHLMPDGRSLIETVGVSRFRVLAHGTLDGYTVGKVERVDDISIAEEEALIASDLYSATSTKLNERIRERRGRPRRDYLRKVKEVLLYVDPMTWASRHDRYEEIAKRLREIAVEADIELFAKLPDRE